MWRGDTLGMLGAWIGLHPGQTGVDVGCGLGYIGYTFWKYFGAGGRYTGVDASAKLLADAREASDEWAVDGAAEFIEGDAYDLPLPDDSADVTVCQALLMHLERPAEAVAEMIRVTKPGGRVVCIEPDNLAAQMAVPFWSLPAFDDDDFLLSRKVYYLAARGRLRLGRDDIWIGRKLPHLMAELGLVDIDIRQNDRIHHIEPPYASELQKDALNKIRQQHLNDERRRTMLQREREEFLAGGGTDAEYDRMEALSEKYLPIFKKQLDEGTYYACTVGTLFVTRGVKPGA